MTKQWYVVHVQSGCEAAVERVLRERIALMGMEDKFGEVLIPVEELVERKKGGSMRKSERKFFPGYVLLEMEMDEEAWHLVRKLPKVLGFIGGTSEKPQPISKKEADYIVARMQASEEAPTPKVLFQAGEVVRVTDGPFSDFNGVVEEVNYEKSRLRVAVLIFGRSTPVELEFSQVEKG